MTEPVIELDGVDKAYRFFRLSDVRLRLEAGQIMGFVGPNGAGKSTTIRILMAHGPARIAARCASSAARCRASRRRPSATSASSPRTCACTASATLAWHMRFVASIYPGLGSDSTPTRCCSASTCTPSSRSRRLSHGERVKATLLLVLAQASAPAAPRRADDRPRSGRPARDPRRADGRRPRRAPRDSVLVAQHPGRRADLRSDHVHRSRPDHRLERQGDVPRSVAPAAPRQSRPASRCRRLPGVVDTTTSGRIAVVTTKAYTPDLDAVYERAGVTVRDVQRMTLEEIFVANVMNNRRETAA